LDICSEEGLRKRVDLVVVSIAAIIVTLFLEVALQRNIRGAAPGTARVFTYHNDVARTGQNLDEKILTLHNVTPGQFGKVGFLNTDGLVDAEPLYVSNLDVAGHPHNVVFVVTEHDSVYAFDADTLSLLWNVTVLAANETPSDDRGCAQVTPEIGITSTPVIHFNASGGTMYLVAMSKDGNGNYFQRLHALDVTSGAEIPGSPTTIEATYPNRKGHTTFDPKQYKERASLLLLNGVVYTSWASHCDNGEYTGWIIGYDAGTLKQAAVLNVTPNGDDGAIWMSGAGPAADPDGNIYLLDGNGTFDQQLDSAGFPVNGDFGNAFLKLSTVRGKLVVADYFNMHNTAVESGRDEDLGSGGALVLPDLQDASGKTWQLAVGAGKDRRIYLVNRNSMGKYSPKKNTSIYQQINNELTGPVFSMPALFNNTLYFGSVNDNLKAFTISNARIIPEPTSKSAAHFAYPGTTPSVSANGNSDAIVWAVEARGSDAGVLHAYDGTNLGHELYNSAQTRGRDAFSDNKFITPMIANGRVFVGTLTGVTVFGVLPQPH
jgi:outer membrane protein assembly factor BamB